MDFEECLNPGVRKRGDGGSYECDRRSDLRHRASLTSRSSELDHLRRDGSGYLEVEDFRTDSCRSIGVLGMLVSALAAKIEIARGRDRHVRAKMQRSSKRDLFLILGAGFVRAIIIGFIGVVLAVLLFRDGLSSVQIGIVIGSGLAGAGLATSLSAVYVDQLGRRPSLCVLSFLTVAPLVALALKPAFPIVLPFAFLGMLNAMGSDRSAAFAIEQRILPGLVHDRQRTWTLAWYNVVLDAGTAAGALIASLPIAIGRWAGKDILIGYRYILLGLAVLGIMSALAYLFLSRSVEIQAGCNPMKRKVSPESRRPTVPYAYPPGILQTPWLLANSMVMGRSILR
jgi:MFS family permease